MGLQSTRASDASARNLPTYATDAQLNSAKATSLYPRRRARRWRLLARPSDILSDTVDVETTQRPSRTRAGLPLASARASITCAGEDALGSQTRRGALGREVAETKAYAYSLIARGLLLLASAGGGWDVVVRLPLY